MNNSVQSLIEDVRHLGHPEYPLLSASYSPSTGIPCMDFTPWITQQISSGDVSALRSFAEEFTGIRPTAGKLVDLALRFDPNKQLCLSPSAALEFRAAWLMCHVVSARATNRCESLLRHLIHDGLFVHDISVKPEFAKLAAARVKRLIKSRLKEGLGCDIVGDVTEQDLVSPHKCPDSQLIDALRNTSIGLRLHLQDTWRMWRADGVSLLKTTFYSTREFGIDVEGSAKAWAHSGLFRFTQDPEKLSKLWNKEELIELSASLGLSAKKSMSKYSLFELVWGDEEGKRRINCRAEQDCFVEFNPDAKALLGDVMAHHLRWKKVAYAIEEL